MNNESAIIFFDPKLLAKRRHLRGRLELREDMINIGKWIDTLGEIRKKIKQLSYFDSSNKVITEGENIIKRCIKVNKHRKRFKDLGIISEHTKEYGDTYYSLFIALMEYATHGLWDEKKKRSYDRSRYAQIQIANNFLK
jgi:hypothetical protein